MKIASERLALWFLRLNGFLTIPNFIVHPEGPREDGAYPQQTDVDVLGVRFPFRAENRERPMPDHPLFAGEPRQLVVLSEVKLGQCGLNGPWTNPRLQNMQKLLCAGGFRPREQADEIAASLYRNGIWNDDAIVIRIVCFGDEHNAGVARSHRHVPQLLWRTHVLPFIYERFESYRLEKQMHHQWDRDGKELFDLASQVNRGDSRRFCDSVSVV